MSNLTIALPAEAPVMVLPGAVLFPGAILPLRIFEPRYCKMLDSALANERMFCVALMKPGLTEAETVDQFFHTAGIGLVSASVTQADGTSHLMLQGLSRVRFTGFSRHSPFRVAKIEALPDVTHDPAETVALADALREQYAAIRVNGAPLPGPIASLTGRIADPGLLADTIAHSLLGDPMIRQQFIEELDIPSRLRRLAQILREYFPRQEPEA